MDEWMDVSDHSYISRDGHHLYGLICSQSLGTPGSHQAHTHALSLSLSRQAVGQSDRRRLITSTHGTLWIGGKPSWSADITQDQRRAPQLREGDPPRSRGRWGGCHWPHRSRMASPGRRGSDAGVAGVATGGRGGVCSVCMYVRSLDTGLSGCMFRTTSKRASSVRLCLFACQGLETTLPYSLARSLSLSLEYECIISCMSVASAVPRHARGERGTIPSHLTTNEGLHHSLLTTTRHSPLVQPEQRFPSPCHAHSCPDAGWAAWPDSHGAVEKGLVTASLVHWSGRVELVGRVVVSETGRA